MMDPNQSQQQLSEKSDGELLQKFLLTQEEEYFAELVCRHSKMVMSVCTRVLHHEQDAQDALQAVFLTLASKAKSLTGRETIAGWLYYVARNISHRLQESRSLREVREKEAGMTQNPFHDSEKLDEQQELRTFLDSELDRLPEKYRLPMILHYFEEKTMDQVAKILRVKNKAVEARISRARLKLQKRLLHRGVQLSVAGLGTLLTLDASAAISNEVVISTTTAAKSILAAKTTSAAAISPKVAALMKGMINTMFINKLITTVSTLIILGLVTGTTIKATTDVRKSDPALTIKKRYSNQSEDINRQLDRAAISGKIGEARDLLSKGANPNVTVAWSDFKPGTLPLGGASANGKLEMVKLLLEHGASVNGKNGLGHTALFNAAMYGQVEAMKLLIDAGADVNARDKNGETALKYVQDKLEFERKKQEVIALLREHGAVE
jgi:RNA polymerase sigma factor (sigma-70 family)